MLGIIPLLQSNAEQKLFTQFDLNRNEQIYNNLVTAGEEHPDYLDLIAGMSADERINLLAYIGLHDRKTLSDPQYEHVQEITADILNDPIISLDEIFDAHQKPTVQLLLPHIRDMMLSETYESELREIYSEVAGREPLEFWQNFDIFKNMLAFGYKRKSLYTVEVAYEGNLKIYKVNPAFDQLEQMLNEDIQTISEILEMDAPKVHLVYHPLSKSLAWYKEKTHSISINLASANLTWPKLTGEVLWHEIYHAYQYHLINTYIHKDFAETKTDFIQDKSKAERIWLAAIYNANLIGYQRSHLSYALYRNQPIEDSAWNFGHNIYNDILGD